MFTREEVEEATNKYFSNDKLATDVFFKYILKDEDGNFLEKDPNDLHLRLAKEFARIEKKYPNPISEEQIFKYLEHFKYIVPQRFSDVPELGINIK